MAVFAAMFPILPGKTEKIVEVGKTLSTHPGFAESQHKLNVPVESWHVQNTPMGDFLLVYLEAADPLHMFQTFAGGSSESDVLLKSTILECTGVDLNQPMPALPSYPVLDFRA
jgi:hypothetical protein